MNNRSSNLPRRLLATGLAVCAHAVVLLLLGWRVPRLAIAVPVGPETGVMEITLMRPPQRPRSQPAAKPARSGPSTSAFAPRVLTAPAPAAPTVMAPVTSPSAQPPAPSADANPGEDRLRNALRGLTGCADPSAARLSRDEREACNQRLAAAKPGPAGSLSVEEQAQFDPPKQPPISIRKPHNGCLPHVGDTPSPIGSNAKTTTFGIACGWSF